MTLDSHLVCRAAYSPRGGNGHIRYLLIAIEDYLQWDGEGGQGTPVCKDKTRVLDIANTTLEHIYPQKLEAKDCDADLELMKHALGNLTVLGPGENDAAGNKNFADKREALEKSNLRINRRIAVNEAWTKADVDKRTAQLAEIAEKIFAP